MALKPVRTWLIALAAAALVACGGGGPTDAGTNTNAGPPGTGSDSAASMGTLRIALTDSPACGYDNAWVTVEKVRVHRDSSAGDGDGGWIDLPLPQPQPLPTPLPTAQPLRVDLLTLTNGTLVPLGQTQLPAGVYTQIRLVLAENTASNPYANAIKPTGGSIVPLTTPSAQQSGLKINADITVPAGQEVDFAIDFDACKSFVKSGNSGKYAIKPVLTVTPIVSSSAQRVVGYVDPVLAAGNTSISLQQGGVSIKGTVPGANGSFVLYPVPAGIYDLVVTSAGRATTVMTGVPVTTTAVTTVNALATVIAPPALVQGTQGVTGSVSPATATVRSLQTLSGGLSIETHWASVDATSGEFTFSLPIDPPVRTVYAPNTPTMTLTPDALALGLYTIEARLDGNTETQAIDTKAAVPWVTLSFP